MSTIPDRAILAGSPDNAEAQAWLLAQYDYLVSRVGNPSDKSGGAFYKADPSSVAFAKLSATTAQLKAETWVDVGGRMLFFGADTNIVMPGFNAGTDYAIYACTDGTVRADASFTAPTGYTTASSRKIGGFHYAPGGHSGSPGGGNSTPQINEYSFWDLKWRPACADPRGMTLVAGSFWSDIYLLGVDHQINGSSKYAVTIADGSSPPKIPAKFGGNGSTAYGSLNWWEAAEVGQSFGKRLPAYDEFSALAYGTTENSSIGSDPGSTIWAAAYVSKWGVNQATGVLWTWGAEFSYRQDGSATPWNWRNSTGGRGQLYLYSDIGLVASVFGGDWVDAAGSGSRASNWGSSPWDSGGDIGARLVCDHLSLD